MKVDNQVVLMAAWLMPSINFFNKPVGVFVTGSVFRREKDEW